MKTYILSGKHVAGGFTVVCSTDDESKARQYIKEKYNLEFEKKEFRGMFMNTSDNRDIALQIFFADVL